MDEFFCIRNKGAHKYIEPRQARMQVYPEKQKIPPLGRILVPKMGLEPTQENSHTPLKRACLPIPPLRQVESYWVI
jgi:hypothetical protein